MCTGSPPITHHPITHHLLRIAHCPSPVPLPTLYYLLPITRFPLPIAPDDIAHGWRLVGGSLTRAVSWVLRKLNTNMRSPSRRMDMLSPFLSQADQDEKEKNYNKKKGAQYLTSIVEGKHGSFSWEEVALTG